MGFCGEPGAKWAWKHHPHSLMADVGGSSCIHCGLRVPTERIPAARATACPCHLLWCDGDEIIEGTIMLRGVLALRACWQAWFRVRDQAKAPACAGAPLLELATPFLPQSPSWLLTGTTWGLPWDPGARVCASAAVPNLGITVLVSSMPWTAPAVGTSRPFLPPPSLRSCCGLGTADRTTSPVQLWRPPGVRSCLPAMPVMAERWTRRSLAAKRTVLGQWQRSVRTTRLPSLMLACTVPELRLAALGRSPPLPTGALMAHCIASSPPTLGRRCGAWGALRALGALVPATRLGCPCTGPGVLLRAVRDLLLTSPRLVS